MTAKGLPTTMGCAYPVEEIGERPLEEGFEKEIRSLLKWQEQMEKERQDEKKAMEKERQENQKFQAALKKDVDKLKQDKRKYATKVGAVSGGATGGVGGGIYGGLAVCGSKAAVVVEVVKGAAVGSVAGAVIGGAVAYLSCRLCEETSWIPSFYWYFEPTAN